MEVIVRRAKKGDGISLQNNILIANTLEVIIDMIDNNDGKDFDYVVADHDGEVVGWGVAKYSHDHLREHKAEVCSIRMVEEYESFDLWSKIVDEVLNCIRERGKTIAFILQTKGYDYEFAKKNDFDFVALLPKWLKRSWSEEDAFDVELFYKEL